jgi:serine/threonine protein kinase
LYRERSGGYHLQIHNPNRYVVAWAMPERDLEPEFDIGEIRDLGPAYRQGKHLEEAVMAELPEFIGKYKIESLVARGGMGAVLKALHPTLKRHVVLKKLTIRGSSAIAERFKREARILIEFQHDNVVRVFDHFKEGSSHYMVLEYVDGLSLDQLLKKQRFLSSELSLTIFAEACKALSYAHGKGRYPPRHKAGQYTHVQKGRGKARRFRHSGLRGRRRFRLLPARA